MRDRLLWETILYSFLYSLVMAPLCAFIGMFACLAVGPKDAGVGAFYLVLGFGFFFSYKLGRANALRRAKKAAAEAPPETLDKSDAGGPKVP